MDGTQAFLVPKHDLLVRDPETKNPLAKGGEFKPLVGSAGRYWRRQIRDGSVVAQNPVAEVAAKKNVSRKDE